MPIAKAWRHQVYGISVLTELWFDGYVWRALTNCAFQILKVSFLFNDLYYTWWRTLTLINSTILHNFSINYLIAATIFFSFWCTMLRHGQWKKAFLFSLFRSNQFLIAWIKLIWSRSISSRNSALKSWLKNKNFNIH